MVSIGLRQVLERARARFGVEMEILDANLRSVYPDGRTDLARVIDDSPGVRGALMQILMAGRPERLQNGAADYAFYPLGQSPRRRQPSGLLAIRRPEAAQTQAADPWSDLARVIIETDLAAAQTIGDERARSRRLLGVLRFLDVVAEAHDHSCLTRALVHAAAVWYDVDARVYRRDPDGEFVLDSWLPGVQPEGAAQWLAGELGDASPAIRRTSLGGHGGVRPGEVGSDPAARLDGVVLIPMARSGRADWVLALHGSVPVEDDAVLRMVAVTAGARLAELDEIYAQQTQRTCESLLADVAKAPELAVVRVLRFLTDAAGAASGSVLLSTGGSARRIAAVGATGHAAAADGTAAPSRLSYRLELGEQDYAVLEMTAAAGHTFPRNAAVIAQAGAVSLRLWLAGWLASGPTAAVGLDAGPAHPAFTLRIQEELERARRFDLRLSILLVAVAAPREVVAQLQDALRDELRGSDVTGALNSTQVAALLTHTDALGLDHAARRVKARLARAAEQLNLSNVRLGQAELSSDVRSADALLELAWRQAESVTRH